MSFTSDLLEALAPWKPWIEDFFLATEVWDEES